MPEGNNRRISVSAFETANICAVHTETRRQFSLCQAFRLSQSLNIFSYQLAHIIGHGPSAPYRCTLMRRTIIQQIMCSIASWIVRVLVLICLALDTIKAGAGEAHDQTKAQVSAAIINAQRHLREIQRSDPERASQLMSLVNSELRNALLLLNPPSLTPEEFKRLDDHFGGGGRR